MDTGRVFIEGQYGSMGGKVKGQHQGHFPEGVLPVRARPRADWLILKICQLKQVFKTGLCVAVVMGNHLIDDEDDISVMP